MFITFFRALRFAWQNYWRNIWLSLVTVFILVLTLFSISLVTSVNLVAGNAIQAIKEKIDVDVYFKQDVTENDIQATKTFLESLPAVKSIRYVTSEQALESFKEEHKTDDAIQASLKEIENNPLPASFVIEANDLKDYPKISKAIEDSEFNKYIEGKDFEDNQVVIDKLSQITDRVYHVGFAVSVVFVFIAILVIFNTIRINIYTYREELGIMRLVGASNIFIRGPFILDSMMYALSASIITTAFLYPIVQTSSKFINGFFEGYNFDLFQFFINNFYLIFAVQLGVSLVLCIISSMIAIGRYLRV